MPLFREIERPATNAPFESQIDWAARRDPIGHKVHLALALFALTLVPLSSTAASIGSTPLLIYALMRFPTIRHTWRCLTRNACWICLCLFFAWLAVSLAWSPDPQHGARLLRGARYLIIVPALLPLMRHANLLLAAVCTGVFIQNSAQIIEWMIHPRSATGGLDDHPGFTGLWFTFCIGILLTASSGNTRQRLILQTSSIIPAIGIMLTTARSVLLGAALAIACLAIAKIVKRPGWKSISAVLVLVMGALVYGVIAPESPMLKRIDAAISGFESRRNATLEDIPSYEETRYIWWEIGLDHFRHSWLFGDGLGSAEVSITNDPRITVPTKSGVENTYLLRDDYHSSFVTCAAESGIIGLTLLITWLGLLACQLPNGRRIRAALAMALIGYLVFSVFNTTIFSGRVLCLPMVLIAFTINPLPNSRSIKSAVAVPTEEESGAGE